MVSFFLSKPLHLCQASLSLSLQTPSQLQCNGPPPHPGHALHARLTPPTTPVTCRHARLITLRAGWESPNQIWLMQHFSSDKRNFPEGHPSRDYSMRSTLNYGVPIHLSSLKRVGQLLKDLGT